MKPPEKISLKKQSVWLLLAKVVGFGFSFLLPLLIVRFLSRENVGLYRESFQIITNLATILPLGFSMSAYYFLARETDRRSAAIFNILLFNFVVGGAAFLVLFLFPQILGGTLQSAELTVFAPKIGVIVWLWIFSTFLETAAIANQEARTATAFIIFAQFSKTFLMLAAVVVFSTVEAFLYAAIVQGALQTVILLVYLNSRFPRFWTQFDGRFFVEQALYAIPLGLAGALWILQTDVHNYFVIYKFSKADFAVYAYGCFQLPLIGMLAESVASVLIPRMSELEIRDDKAEMIRLTTRAMSKLSFFYFPAYVFLMITAQTFIVTLFTRNYLASVPIFMINLTLMPFSIIITDPIVRAHKKIGRTLLILRIIVVGGLLTTLYFGAAYFDMREMIGAAVASFLLEKFIAESFIVKKLGFGIKDLHLLKNVGKTALAAVFAGAVTYAFYFLSAEFLFTAGQNAAENILETDKISVADFVGGGLTLAVSALIYAAVYLSAANYFALVEDGEKQQIVNIYKKIRMMFGSKKAAESYSQTIN